MFQLWIEVDVDLNQTEIAYVCDLTIGEFHAVEVFQIRKSKLAGNLEANSAFGMVIQVLVNNMVKLEIPVGRTMNHYDEKFYVWASEDFMKPAPVKMRNLLFDVFTEDGIYPNKPNVSVPCNVEVWANWTGRGGILL